MKLGTYLTLLTLGILAVSRANATVVTYSLSDVSGSTWDVNYSLTNDTLGSSIQELTIFFPVGEYSNLTVSKSPSNWNSLVAQPDPALPADGFFDTVAMDGGLAPGATASGFSVTFNWLGSGTPGPQLFNIVDPNTFATLDAGMTVQASPVPLPQSGLSLICGLLGVAWLFRRQQPRVVSRETTVRYSLEGLV